MASSPRHTPTNWRSLHLSPIPPRPAADEPNISSKTRRLSSEELSQKLSGSTNCTSTARAPRLARPSELLSPAKPSLFRATGVEIHHAVAENCQFGCREHILNILFWRGCNCFDFGASSLERTLTALKSINATRCNLATIGSVLGCALICLFDTLLLAGAITQIPTEVLRTPYTIEDRVRRRDSVHTGP